MANQYSRKHFVKRCFRKVGCKFVGGLTAWKTIAFWGVGRGDQRFEGATKDMRSNLGAIDWLDIAVEWLANLYPEKTHEQWLQGVQGVPMAARAKRERDRNAGLTNPSHTKPNTVGARGAGTVPSQSPTLTQTKLTDPRTRAPKRQKLPLAQRPAAALPASAAHTGQRPTDKVVQQQRQLDRAWTQLWPELQPQVLYERDDAARPETLAQYRHAFDAINKHTERFTPAFLNTKFK
eukprot:SAG31_NODE_2_length_46263_cov_45.908043_3_plen_235_part_00